MDDEARFPFHKVCIQLDDVLRTLRDAGYRQALRKGVVDALHELGYENVVAQKKVSGKLVKRRFWVRAESLTGASPSELHELLTENPDR